MDSAAPGREGLRERTRRAVRAELSEAAQELFLAHGYEHTTVEQIADAVGISRRSFFRYFKSKEDVVVDKYELHGDDLVAALARRPLDEPTWDALRRTFDVVVDYYADAHRRERAAVMQRIVTSSPSLFARYLRKLDDTQNRLALALNERDARRDPRSDLGDTLNRALVGAAYACLSAALRSALSSADPSSLSTQLDDVMDQLRPSGA